MTAAPVRAEQRHTKRNRCPICGGADGDPRSKGRRCHGFTSDGWAHCSREEHAGSLPITDAGTYSHRLNGPCNCGATHFEADNWNGIETVYQYRDERDALLFEVVRTSDKRFYQRRPDRTGSMDGVRRVLYRLPELLKADPSAPVYVVEGEKDADRLRSLGLVATCNPMGAKNWKQSVDCARSALRGRHLVVIPDDDDDGRGHTAAVLASMTGIAATIRTLELYPRGATKRDVSDWLDAGNTVAALADMVATVEPASTSETTPASRWQITRASADWITIPLPPREHLFVDERTGRGAIDRCGAWLLAGAGGAGKSYSTISKAMAVACGGLWLGTFRASRSGRALIIAAEDSVEDIRRRVHAIALADGGYPADAIGRVHVLSLGDRVTSLVAQQSDVYIASADTLSLCAELEARDPYDLVVVDPYGRIAGVSVDSDNAAAAATISALAMISSAARGLVLGVTHTSARARLAARGGAPEGATGVRGATGQVDYARGVLRLERDESDVTTLSLAKANHVAPWEPVALRRGERGELLPLSADERSAADAARKPRTKAERTEARERDTRERDRLDDVAARQALGKHPGASVRELTAIVRGARTCGQERAHAAVTRVRLAAEGDEA